MAWILLTGLADVVAPARADPPDDKPGKSGKPAEPGQGSKKGNKKESSAAQTLDAAVERAERKYRARVIRADEAVVDGRRAYLLRLLSEEGRMWTVRVDAASGAEF